MIASFAGGVAAAAGSEGFWLLAFAALAGGLVRGFTGFGFAMVFMPLAGLVLPLPLAVAVIWAIDAPFSFPLAARSAPRARWFEVVPLLAAATVAMPVGLWLLMAIDPVPMRWLLAGLIGAAVAALATGWRWRGQAGLPLSLGVGAMSGLATGLASLGGLPLAIFWLSAQAKSALQMRDDLMCYFACATIVSGAVLWWKGLLSAQALLLAVPLMLPYGVGVVIGSQGYRFASERLFRRLAHLVIALAALVSLPLWDGWLGR